MYALLVSIGVIAALVRICALFSYEFLSLPIGGVLLPVFIAAFAVAVIAGYWIRRTRLQTWTSVSGRIESCSLGTWDKRMRQYRCVYLFSVDGVRQAGEVAIWDRTDRLEEIKAAVVGQEVNVRYDPSDCTKSILEETSINGWNVR
ncbi:MAG TPA: DUF3592 domain-containing protein [Candidatus Sulfotelmatobacter sp.]